MSVGKIGSSFSLGRSSPRTDVQCHPQIYSAKCNRGQEYCIQAWSRSYPNVIGGPCLHIITVVNWNKTMSFSTRFGVMCISTYLLSARSSVGRGVSWTCHSTHLGTMLPVSMTRRHIGNVGPHAWWDILFAIAYSCSVYVVGIRIISSAGLLLASFTSSFRIKCRC